MVFKKGLKKKNLVDSGHLDGRISIRDRKSSTENRDSSGTRISRCSPARDRVYRLAARATRFIGSLVSSGRCQSSRAGRNVIASPRYFAAATKGSGHPRPRERGPTLARVDDSRENNATSRLEYFIARKRVFLAARALPRLLSPARVMPFSGRRGRRAFRQREPLFDARQRTG